MKVLMNEDSDINIQTQNIHNIRLRNVAEWEET